MKLIPGQTNQGDCLLVCREVGADFGAAARGPSVCAILLKPLEIEARECQL